MKWKIGLFFLIGCLSMHSAEFLAENDIIVTETTVVSTDADGNLVVEYIDTNQADFPNTANIQENFEKLQLLTQRNSFDDTYDEDRQEPIYHTRSKRDTTPTIATGMVELLIVLDKEFGDVFQQNYQKIVDYLTVYFWDVNLRFKTLISCDISFRVVGLVALSSKQAQPFIENSRNSSGIVQFDPLMQKFGEWMYQQRSWVAKHDMALLMTNAKTERSGGLAINAGTCRVDPTVGRDLNTVFWTDDGGFTGLASAPHEIAHCLGAFHDDEPGQNCPYGFIMSSDSGSEQYRHYFSKCSDNSINSFVKSSNADCLRRIDATSNPALDANFANLKAGTMDETCKSLLGPKCWVDEGDKTNCKQLLCRCPIENMPGYITLQPRVLVENIKCGSGGRCFRGKCRPEGKLLMNENSGRCLSTDSRVFGYQTNARMTTCPSSKSKTPLDTIEIRTVPSGFMLATPYIYNNNLESGDKCFAAEYAPGAAWPTMRTNKCDPNDSSQIWQMNMMGDTRFQLRHAGSNTCLVAYTGADYTDLVRCVYQKITYWNLVDGV